MTQYPPTPMLRSVMAPPVAEATGGEVVVDPEGVVLDALEADGYDHFHVPPKKFFAHAGGSESK